MKNSTEYGIRTLTRRDVLEDMFVSKFIHDTFREITKIYPEIKHPEKFNFFGYIETHRVRICFRNGEPVGIMMAQIFPSVFDPSLKIIMQDLLYTKPGTKAAKLLLDDFISFGKANAQHIITMIARGSNIKSRSLERLGFTKFEELYRMEI